MAKQADADRFLSFRVKDADVETIDRAARRLGWSRSEFLRRFALAAADGVPVEGPDDS